MAKTLLNAVNEILKRTGTISGDSGALSTLADTARQRQIDIAVQVINEGLDELYSAARVPLPQKQAESSITLVTSTRSYSLASGLVKVRWPFVDRTNTQYIHDFPGGYNDLLLLDPEQDDTGLPFYGAISPVNGNLHLDRAPTSVEAGNVYYYQYDKDLALSAAEDEVPFPNIVFRAMVPAWVQLWRRDMNNAFDDALFKAGIGRASRFINPQFAREHYSPRA